ncbi:hypothetical protein PVA38_12210 [Streptococcus pneumoniae D39]|nr:hypothetical protein PVA38_12210 [Streptococcus pneumoniae D39]
MFFTRQIVVLTVKASSSLCQTTFDLFCLLYTSDAADEARSVDLGGRRTVKKKRTYGSRHRTRRET